MFTKISIFFVVGFIHWSTAELRWCRVSNVESGSARDGWVQFEDTSHSCVECSPDSTVLLESSKLPLFECCNGKIVEVGNCERSLQDETASCSNAIRCDGIKQCVNGSDEMGCASCGENNTFLCPIQNQLYLNLTQEVCIPQSKVCNSHKDCVLGFDETGCEWHRGWCDGFLCGKPHERCIPKSQVCDGTKQCIDGSDEVNCLFCNNQFQCEVVELNDTGLQQTSSYTTRTAKCIGKFRVCDGQVDCGNGLDETNCFRWSEWGTWSACSPPVVCTRSRTRSCVSSKSAIEVDPIYCYDVEDYHAVAGLPSVEQQSQICPACIPTLPPVAPPQVDPPLPNDGPKVEVKLLEDDGTLTGSSNLVQNRNRGLEMSLNLTDTETESSDNVLTSSIIPSSYQQTLNITLASSAAHSQTSEDASLASLFATKSVSVTSRTASTLAEIAIEKTTVKPSAIFATYTLSNTSTDTRRNATSSVTQSAIVASLLATKSILITETLETATKIESTNMFNETTLMPGAPNLNNITAKASSPRRHNSIVRLILIIAGSAAAAAVFIVFVCVLLCCCRKKQRNRHGKFHLPQTSSSNEVPRMYREVQIGNDDSNNTFGKCVTSQNFTLTRTRGSGDSGIDDTSSTSSHRLQSEHSSETSPS